MDRQTCTKVDMVHVLVSIREWKYRKEKRQKDPKGLNSKPSTLGSGIPWYSPFLAKEHLAHMHTTTPTTKQDAIGAFKPFPSIWRKITGQDNHLPRIVFVEVFQLSTTCVSTKCSTTNGHQVAATKWCCKVASVASVAPRVDTVNTVDITTKSVTRC